MPAHHHHLPHPPHHLHPLYSSQSPSVELHFLLLPCSVTHFSPPHLHPPARPPRLLRSFSVPVLLTCFVCHTLVSDCHPAALPCGIHPISPNSLAHARARRAATASALFMHRVTLSNQGSSNARPLMGDYRCRALIPLSHVSQWRTCSRPERNAARTRCQNNGCGSHDKGRKTDGKKNPKKPQKICRWRRRKKRDCTMTGPRSVVQRLYIAPTWEAGNRHLM